MLTKNENAKRYKSETITYRRKKYDADLAEIFKENTENKARHINTKFNLKNPIIFTEIEKKEIQQGEDLLVFRGKLGIY